MIFFVGWVRLEVALRLSSSRNSVLVAAVGTSDEEVSSRRKLVDFLAFQLCRPMAFLCWRFLQSEQFKLANSLVGSCFLL